MVYRFPSGLRGAYECFECCNSIEAISYPPRFGRRLCLRNRKRKRTPRTLVPEACPRREPNCAITRLAAGEGSSWCACDRFTVQRRKAFGLKTCEARMHQHFGSCIALHGAGTQPPDDERHSFARHPGSGPGETLAAVIRAGLDPCHRDRNTFPLLCTGSANAGAESCSGVTDTYSGITDRGM